MVSFIRSKHTKRFISGSIAALFITLQMPLALLASPTAFAASKNGTVLAQDKDPQHDNVVLDQPVVPAPSVLPLSSTDLTTPNEVPNTDASTTGTTELSTDPTLVKLADNNFAPTQFAAQNISQIVAPVTTIKKITICHRTNSVSNPYVIETVSYDAATGAVKDKGHGDHTSHIGPIFNTNTNYPAPHNGDQWGDIIPSYTYIGDSTHKPGNSPGLNATPAGLAIIANDCKVPGLPVVIPSGSITITKHANPSTEQSFNFTSDITGFSTFSLKGNKVAADNTKTFAKLAYNTTFNITEGMDEGWTLHDINCNDANVAILGSKVSIKLSSGQKDVSCTFNNVRIGTPVDESPAYICHRTNSTTNPYVKESPSAKGVYDGHLKEHTGTVWFLGHAKNPKWGDIIPPFTYEDTSYQLNYTDNEAGQAIYNNGCKVNAGTLTVHKMVDETGNNTYTSISGADAATLGFTWYLNDSKTSNHFDSSVDNYTGEYKVTENNTNENYTYTGWYETSNAEGYSCANPEGTQEDIPVSINKDETTDITLCNQINESPTPEAMTTLCHANVTDPLTYNKVMVPVSEAYNVHYLNHGNDIIPPFNYGENNDISQNFNSVGEATYNNNCVPEHVGLGGGSGTPVTVLAILTPQVIPQVKTVNTPSQLVNTGSTMLLNIFAGLFIIGAASALTAVPSKRRYS